MENIDYIGLLKPVIRIAKEAGAGILNYYGLPSKDIEITRKDDNTLLTEADLSSHDILYHELQQLTPDIPVLSEEDAIPSYQERSQWGRYWLLDPLDGTRGFIDHRDEFTVNIALVEHRKVKLGVVYAPVLRQCYFAATGEGAYKQVADDEVERIHTKTTNWNSFTVFLGYYLSSPHLPAFFKRLRGCHVMRLNSSLKFCRVAEGRGDFYPRLGNTSEWDTAAAQCVLEEAGGALLDLEGESLQYNAKSSLINPAFVAMGDTSQQAKIFDLLAEERKKEDD